MTDITVDDKLKTPLELAEGLQNSNIKEIAFLGESYIKLYDMYVNLQQNCNKLVQEIEELELRLFELESPISFDEGDFCPGCFKYECACKGE